MKGTDLEFAQQNYSYHLRTALEEIRINNARADSFFLITFSYRILAICSLLLNADVTTFRKLLRKAGAARLHFLKQVEAGLSPDEKYICLSKEIGFASALAAKDIQLAKLIAAHSSKQHYQNIEYEDDFLFVFFMQSLLANADDSKNHENILIRWESVLKGQESAYYEVCKALKSEDLQLFEKKFSSLIETRLEELAQFRENFNYDKQLEATEGRVFIEGLALLCLAEINGMKTSLEFQLIPHIVKYDFDLPDLSPWNQIDSD